MAKKTSTTQIKYKIVNILLFHEYRLIYSPTFLVFPFLEDLLSALLEANFERGFLHEASCGLPTINKY